MYLGCGSEYLSRKSWSAFHSQGGGAAGWFSCCTSSFGSKPAARNSAPFDLLTWVQARRSLAHQDALVPEGSPPAAANASVWDAYTYAPNRFYVGSDLMVVMTDTPSAEDCATLCYESEPCWFWAYCPATAGKG